MTNTTASGQHHNRTIDHDLDYRATLRLLQQTFDMSADRPLFVLDVPPGALGQAFLAGLPADQRQHHDCRACLRFLDIVGPLALITDAGTISPFMRAIAAVAPGIYGPAFMRVADVLRRRSAPIAGVLVLEAGACRFGRELDVATDGRRWSHFTIRVGHTGGLRPNVTETSHQASARLLHEHGLVMQALADFTIEQLELAGALLRSDKFQRREKALPQLGWLIDLHHKSTNVPARRSALVWRAVATAPAGWAHVRGNVLGALLTDIADGLDHAAIAKRWNERMDPTQYQRPTAPVTEGNVAQAERMVADLGIASALQRRFARLEEIDAVWKPAHLEAPARSPSVFGHLLKGKPSVQGVDLPPITVTWVKFAATVLPDADLVEVLAPRMGGFCALVTAVDPEAKPILQWDRPTRRNPVSVYTYPDGSSAEQWGLRATYHAATAICLDPAHWYGNPAGNHGQRAIAILQGARDVGYVSSGGFFPEQLVKELHAVRSTLEAYARKAVVAGKDEATACGIFLVGPNGPRIRVTSRGVQVNYRIDRWD